LRRVGGLAQAENILSILTSSNVFCSPLPSLRASCSRPRLSGAGPNLIAVTLSDPAPSPPLQVFTIRPDGTDLTNVSSSSFPDYFAAWSPDRTRLAFVRALGSSGHHVEDFALMTMNADGTDKQEVFRANMVRALLYPTWSPDGQRLAFVLDSGSTLSVFVIDVDGSDLRELARGSEPDWSPAGDRIVYTAYTDEGYDGVFTIGVDGQDRERVTAVDLNATLPKWSPDGAQLLFLAGCNCVPFTPSGIYSARSDGSELRQVYADPPGRLAGQADWSPDGEQVVFLANREPLGGGPLGPRLWIVNADGTNLHEIHHHAGEISSVDWSSAAGAAAVDDVDPVIQIDVPSAGARLTRGSSVLASYSCVDGAGGSGVISCDGDVPDGSPIDTTQLGTHTFTVTAVDAAGNEAARTVTYDVVDRTPPSVTLTTPAAGATYALFSRATVNYTCGEELGGSGLATCTGTQANGTQIPTGLTALGSHAFTVTATDRAGNVTTVRHTYRVSLFGL
jgi:hypothetical protein